ncbi:MAG: HAD-IA family hydrolase [Bauldia litoralis]
MTTRIRLVVFDCDGTMIDSQAGIYDAVSAAWGTLGLTPPPRETARRVVGLPLDRAIAELAPECGPDDHAALCDRYREAFALNRANETLEEPMFPGLVEALDAIEGAGMLLGVATGKSARGLSASLERHGLDRRFVTLQTSDRAPGKPAPDMVLRAMADTGADPDTTVVIGDTSYDMEMAVNAGVAAIGVAWGYHPAEELTDTGAAAIIDHYSQAPDAVRRLIGGA